MIRELQREQAPVRYDLNNDLGISHARMATSEQVNP